MLAETTRTSVSTRVGSHLVQLFDSDQSLADAVSVYLHDGFMRGHNLLAVMDERRWCSVAMRLSASGLHIDEALASGTLTVRDAAAALKGFMRRGRPDRDLFEHSIGDLIRELSARGAPLRIYGEMVNVLAAQGEYKAAHELEELWNDLGRRSEFRLFCGYASGHFGDPQSAAALRRICGSHSHVLSNSQDVLGSFLLHANHVIGN